MQPSERSWDGWRKAAPEGFRYAVKAHRYITHLKRLRDCEDSVERAVTAVRRLGPHLGPLLFQLPPNFKRTAETAARIESFLGMLPRDVHCAVEFRDKTWLTDETLDQLRRHDAAFCIFDSPKLASPIATTRSFAYVRFHGTKSAHGGNYSDRLLDAWANHLRRIADEVEDVYIYFNNDAFGYAVRNARTLTQLLEGSSVPLPAGVTTKE